MEARQQRIGWQPELNTPYINTIPREAEPWFPGDEYLERRIRAFVRWNAAMMVVRAGAASWWFRRSARAT